jgi:hypothetical protein
MMMMMITMMIMMMMMMMMMMYLFLQVTSQNSDEFRVQQWGHNDKEHHGES